MDILLVNPWISDFKAYDEWMRPMPLYRFQENYARTHRVGLVDCLDATVRQKKYSTAEIASIPLDKPEIFSAIPRRYKRYGITGGELEQRLISFGKPDVVFMTTLMTYWYPGVADTISTIRGIWPNVPIVVGGIYATLMPEHAFYTLGAKIEEDWDHWERVLGVPSRHYLTAKEMRGVLPLRVVEGCPFRCPYCASRRLHGNPTIPEAIEEQQRRLTAFAETGGVDVVFYDDALLHKYKENSGRLFEWMAGQKNKFRVHLPNGLHARSISSETAQALAAATVTTLRLGFEGFGNDNKATPADIEKAVHNLAAAGFGPNEIGVYLLIGLEKSLAPTKKAFAFLKGLGVKIYANQISPVPGSPLYNQIAMSKKDLITEPLFHNDATFIFTHCGFDWNEVADLKQEIKEYNEKLPQRG